MDAGYCYIVSGRRLHQFYIRCHIWGMYATYLFNGMNAKRVRFVGTLPGNGVRSSHQNPLLFPWSPPHPTIIYTFPDPVSLSCGIGATVKYGPTDSSRTYWMWLWGSHLRWLSRRHSPLRGTLTKLSWLRMGKSGECRVNSLPPWNSICLNIFGTDHDSNPRISRVVSRPASIVPFSVQAFRLDSQREFHVDTNSSKSLGCSFSVAVANQGCSENEAWIVYTYV